jgi:3-polyprenyl-4-hydroxybenzoate decarboxylase
MHAIWGAGQMSWTKCIFVVDHDVDVHDHHAVLRAAGHFCNPARDIETVRGPLDILDHAAPYLGAGTKIGFDCTPKRDGEQGSDPNGPLKPREPFDITSATQFADRVAQVKGVLEARVFEQVPHWLFVRIDRDHGDEDRSARGRRVLSLIQAFSETLPSTPLPVFVVALGRGVALDQANSLDQALFHWCANFDPGRDSTLGGYIRYPDGQPTLRCSMYLMDASPKSPRRGLDGDRGGLGSHAPVRPFPPVLSFQQSTRDLITRRWSEYGLDRYQPVG